MRAQWGNAVEGTPNGRRRIHATGRPSALFTRGNTHYWGEADTRPLMNLGDEAIRPARRPFRDAEYVPARTDTKITVCPGCGIVPPRGRPCDQCWG